MADPYISEIRLFGFDFAPRGWAQCNGAVLAISQNQALFALLGTTYGGDGIQTFALPDLRGRSIVSSGQGPGLSPYVEGQRAGTEGVALSTNSMPQHVHGWDVSTAPGSNPSPVGTVLMTAPLALGNAFGSSANNVMPGALNSTGGSQAHENRMPSLVLNYSIAIVGIFPSRN